MSQEERVSCPKCGAVVVKGERFCKFCGADLLTVSLAATEPTVAGVPLQPEVAPQPAYERRFSFFGRLHSFVFSPSEAMKDVALAPDYGGVFAVLIAEMVLAGVAVALVFQKFQLVGSNASQVNALVSSVLTLGVILAFGLVIVQWLVKSALVRVLCDSGSKWSFKVAAVVTGYAYFADVVVAFVGLFVMWWFIPSVVIDVSNLDAARQSIANFQASVAWMRFFYSLPITLVGLLWKSYLGALGSHHGTKKLCSVSLGFGVFFVLGLIGVLISFVL